MILQVGMVFDLEGRMRGSGNVVTVEVRLISEKVPF